MIAIVDYGLGNLKSVKSACDRLGVEAAVTADPAAILGADGVIFPGVGAFSRAVGNLRQLGILNAVADAARAGKPFLGICLGLQLLFTESSEHGRHEGLDIVPGRVVRFDTPGLKVPHMGWNQVRQERPSALFEGVPDESFFYFAHSYYAVPDDADVVVGSADYGVRFAAAVQKDNVFATQFHPEKSGPLGLGLLENFCRLCSNDSTNGSHGAR